MAWSHDSRRFVIVGNGHNSSVVVYDIIYSNPDRNSPRLKEAWRVRAGQHSNTPEKHAHHHSDNKTGGKDEEDVVEMNRASVSYKDTSGLDYQYGDAFYMAEINPLGNVFAVEERPGKSTLARLYSHGGKLLNTSELHAPTTAAAGGAEDANSESAKAGGGSGDKKPGVQTLVISTYKAGCYALVVQGGYVLLVDAEKLTITNSFKVVSIIMHKISEQDGTYSP